MAALAIVLVMAAPAAAHPHEVTNGHGDVVTLANGQNHPGFVEDAESGLFLSCEGIADLPNMGPAGYGLETAHHGPDAGIAGKADGCYATDGAPQDDNPAID
jgi:hypothetical protein